MKQLNSFLEFNTNKFFEGKDLRITGDDQWVEYVNNVPQPPKGTKYKCFIITDNTKYGDDIVGVNEGEAIIIKVPASKKPYKKLSKVKLVNPQCRVYGDYRNQLSITADDINFEQ